MSFKRKMFGGIREFLDELKNNLLPSGAVVWFDRTTAPTGWVVCNGQTYTDSAGNTKTAPNLIGRYALGATSGIGGLVEAGLPNIRGRIGPIGEEGTDYTTGPFYQDGSGGSGDKGGWDYHVFMDLSRVNPIFGRSSTVTPPSCKLLPCVKK